MFGEVISILVNILKCKHWTGYQSTKILQRTIKSHSYTQKPYTCFFCCFWVGVSIYILFQLRNLISHDYAIADCIKSRDFHGLVSSSFYALLSFFTYRFFIFFVFNSFFFINIFNQIQSYDFVESFVCVCILLLLQPPLLNRSDKKYLFITKWFFIY